jgi:hypothetical protein
MAKRGREYHEITLLAVKGCFRNPDTNEEIIIIIKKASNCGGYNSRSFRLCQNYIQGTI